MSWRDWKVGDPVKHYWADAGAPTPFMERCTVTEVHNDHVLVRPADNVGNYWVDDDTVEHTGFLSFDLFEKEEN